MADRSFINWGPFLDRLGVFGSIGCAIHCMIAPFILILLPTLGGWWVHPGAHFAIAALVLPVAGFALHRGFLKHAKKWVPTAGAIGATLVLVGVALPFVAPSEPDVDAELTTANAEDSAAPKCCKDCCPTVEIDEETQAWTLRIPPASIVTLLGGMALVAAHLGNLRGCRNCKGSCVI